MPIDRDHQDEREARLNHILERIEAAQHRQKSAEIRMRRLIEQQQTHSVWVKEAKAQAAQLRRAIRSSRARKKQ